MRCAACLGLLLLSCGCSTRAAPSTLVVPPRPDASVVQVAATAIGGIDASRSLLVLVTLKNTGPERLVVIGGGSDDDWFDLSFFDAMGEMGGGGESHMTFHGPRAGGMSCPRPEHDLVIPPGSSVGRLQRVRFDYTDAGAISRVQMHLRLFLEQGSLRCGPLGLLEREVEVTLEPNRQRFERSQSQ
jgi:hypothetical protein